ASSIRAARRFAWLRTIPDTPVTPSGAFTSSTGAWSKSTNSPPSNSSDRRCGTRGPPVTADRTPRILIADDQPDVLEALRLLLKPEAYRIESPSSPAGVLTAIDGREFDVVLMDLNYARDTTSGQEGLDLLSLLQARDATLPVVVMTAWGSVDVAVEAMRRGA